MKAVAHPMRLQMFEQLLLGLPIEGYSVNAIRKKLGIHQPTISQHLQTLRNKGIIDGSKTGVEISNKVIDKCVAKIL